MAVDDPNPPPGSAPAGTQEHAPAEHPPAEQSDGSVVDFNKDSVHLGGPGGRRWSTEERALLADWTARVTAAQHAHYYLMTQLRRRNLMLGIPVIVLTAAVGTALFTSIANTDAASVWAKVAAGAVSALAGVLAAIQTFLKFSERAEKHAVAADWLAAVRRELETVAATPEKARGNPSDVLEGLRKEINKISQTAPGIGEALWQRFAKEYGVREPRKANP
jgi:hypothetical protein